LPFKEGRVGNQEAGSTGSKGVNAPADPAHADSYRQAW